MPSCLNKALMPVAGFALLSLWPQVKADPWIPDTGHGVMRPVVRYYSADRSFTNTRFASNTTPSNTRVRETELKVTGEHGIGPRLALEYDLRATTVDKTKNRITASASGLEDQVVGAVYSLRRNRQFAHALALNVVFPVGSTTTNPALGTGAYALEPNYQLGLRHRYQGHFVAAGLTLGPRVFLDGGTTQLRADMGIGAALTRKTALFGDLFYSHTVAGAATFTGGNFGQNTGELYNILRGGLALHYAVTKKLRLIGGYQGDIAGRGIHAGRRVAVGLSWRY